MTSLATLRRELRATGETVHERSDGTHDGASAKPMV